MQSRLYLKFAAVISVIVFVTSIICYFSLGRQITLMLTSEIKKELRQDLLYNKQMLEQNFQELLKSGNAESWVNHVGHAFDVRVTVIDLEGRVLADSFIPQGKLSLVANHRDRPEVTAAFANGYGEETRLSETVKEQMLYIAVPVGFPKPYAILRFSKPLYDIGLFNIGMSKNIEQSFFLTLLFSLITGFVAAFFSYSSLAES